MKVRKIDVIARFMATIARTNDIYITVKQWFSGTGSSNIEVMSGSKIPKAVRDEIANFFDVELVLKHNDGNIEARCEVEEYGDKDTSLSIVFWFVSKCKQVGTERKLVKREITVNAPVYENVEVMEEVPVWECPETGKVLE